MDTFENEELHNDQPAAQPEPQPEPRQTAYSGTGTGRKESPYANSPYVMHSQPYSEPQYQYQPQPPQKPKKAKKPGKGKRVLAVLLALVLIGSLCGGGIFLFQTMRESNYLMSTRIEELNGQINDLKTQLADASVPGIGGAALPADGNAMTPAQLYEACVDSVVAISTRVETSGLYGPQTGTSSGSGFILNEAGYVITNFHVVDGSTAIDVVLHDGTEHPAKIVGTDDSNDIAVLKLEEEVEGLKPVIIGSSEALNIGDMVAAIGNPLGELASTQTIGYVSGVGREVTTDNTIISMIQTDAAINPGNSGGPLFNMYGEVIGITTAKYSGTTGSGATIEGIGFAIPIDDVYGMISDLIDFGYVTGAYLGVTVQNMDEESASMYNLPVGAYVVTVVEDGSADRAGIQPKDIITKLGDTEVSSVNQLTRTLRKFKAGDTTTVTVIRSGQELVLDITLDEKPQTTTTAPVPTPEEEAQMPDEGSFPEWYDFFRRYFG